MTKVRLNLPAIEATLRHLTRDFAAINQGLSAERDPLSERVLGGMLSGYTYLDEALAGDVDFFRLGSARHLLELNARVLCGTDPEERALYAGHLAATERRFYEQVGGGIADLAEWLDRHQGAGPWERAAGAFMQILMPPELFIEGNHRTGALILSHLLTRAGLPPFVLTSAQAGAYFDLSREIRGMPALGLTRLLRLPALQRRLVEVLRRQADEGYLLPA